MRVILDCMVDDLWDELFEDDFCDMLCDFFVGNIDFDLVKFVSVVGLFDDFEMV